ncbi:hypothetical protein [Celeribacter arenosi]|uniref:Lipoprotein n=1 Tax=Celeribacter arenosi TaxID=792649 RepID=A0ABP7K2Q3_9RHOB
MRWLIPFALLPLIAACSQQDACISRASKDYRIVSGLIEETRANIARGYGLTTYSELVESYEKCGEDAEGRDLYCQTVDTVKRQKPVSIDLEAERAKLSSQLAKQAELAVSTKAAQAACIAQYPEG